MKEEFEKFQLDTKPAESVINAVRAQALRDLIPRSDWRGQIHISLVSHLADELAPRCRKCGTDELEMKGDLK